ncbi:MAG: hypothetical protein Q9225_007584, partial [Loekoesia sp. 1 TL-2023]
MVHRMWTAQEFVVANDPFFIYIDANVELIHSVSLLRTVWHKNNRAERCHETLEQLRLENLLVMTADRDAHDPRDHVFALIGLLSGDSAAFTLKYTSPVKELYQNVMVEAMRSTGDLNFLMHTVYSRDQNKFDVPFWCIDFSVRKWDKYKGRFRIFLLQWASYVGYTLGLPFKLEHDLAKGLLRIIGTPIGSVHGSHNSTVESILEQAGASLAKFQRKAMAMNSGLRASRAADTVYKVLLDYLHIRDFCYLALSIRIGPDKAMDLFDKGIIWKVLASGVIQSWKSYEFWELTNKEKESFDYFTAIAKWAEDYTSKCIEEQENLTGKTGRFLAEFWELLFFYMIEIANQTVGTTTCATRNGYIGRADLRAER